MNRTVLFISTALLICSISSTSAFSQSTTSNSPVETCILSDGEAAINVCTSLIESGNLSKTDLEVAFTRRGDVYTELGQCDLAVKDYDQAIKLEPIYKQLYYDRGLAYAVMHKYSLAIQDFNEAIKLSSNYAKAYYARGLTKRNMGDITGGDADIAKANKLDPDIEKDVDN